MTPPIADFRTVRLHVRDWTAEIGDPRKRHDLALRLGAMLEPDVTRYLPPDLSATRDMGRWITARQKAASVMLIETRKGDALAGLLFLFPGPDGNWRLGYLFGRDHWGGGLASEVVTHLVAHWPRHLGPILAGVMDENAASARVLVKAGFVIESQDDGLGMYRFTPRPGDGTAAPNPNT